MIMDKFMLRQRSRSISKMHLWAVVLYHSQSSNQRPVDKNVKNNPSKDGKGSTYNYQEIQINIESMCLIPFLQLFRLLGLWSILDS